MALYNNRTTSDLPAMPQVGIVGAGQLARMLAQSADELSIRVSVLANNLKEPAAQIVPNTVVSTGDAYTDLRMLARGSSVITFDHEGADQEILTQLLAEGINIQPQPAALCYAQNKLTLRNKLSELEITQPDFMQLRSVDDLIQFSAKHHGNIVLKLACGGYDGRGVWINNGNNSPESHNESLNELVVLLQKLLAANTPVIVEEKIEFSRELAVQIARSPFGQVATWPVVETRQHNGQCSLVIAPAPHLADQSARFLINQAITLAQTLNITGVFTMEILESVDGTLYVNEVAMRPHNSGHWTMNGSLTSQFEQHLRAVLDYPLGNTDLLAPMSVMANVIGSDTPPSMPMDERVHHLCARMPEVKIHLYGKGERKDRKIGHVNLVQTPNLASYVHIRDNKTSPDAQVSALVSQATLAAHWLSTGQWHDGWDPHGNVTHKK